ncbi:MAG: hypothetical protein OXC95_08395 [Dehalococcoidia bacterium]|nr:hypothetical protein [Dehalococcoidia bacterium]
MPLPGAGGLGAELHLVFYDLNSAWTVKVHTVTQPAAANCDKLKRRWIRQFAPYLFGRLAVL